ncbi:MAG: hypothetical protein J6J21_06540 [Clostridia bacterium]|nr:hypothetical protein [Clostridia bacterium]
MNTERIIAYRCPVCGTAIVGDLNLFVLGGQELKLSCKECGEEAPTLVASLTKENKLSLALPCLTCPNPHRFTVETQVVFSRDLFVLQCPMTALDLCFIGTEEKVEEALEENRKQLLELTGGEWMDDEFDEEEEEWTEEELKEFKEHPPLLDAHLMGQMLYLVRDLAEEGKISCSCGEQHVDFHLLPDGIAFSCPKCNAARVFPAHSESDLERLSELTELVLSSEENEP